MNAPIAPVPPLSMENYMLALKRQCERQRRQLHLWRSITAITLAIAAFVVMTGCDRHESDAAPAVSSAPLTSGECIELTAALMPGPCDDSSPFADRGACDELESVLAGYPTRVASDHDLAVAAAQRHRQISSACESWGTTDEGVVFSQCMLRASRASAGGFAQAEACGLMPGKS